MHDVGPGDVRNDLEVGAERLDRAVRARRARRARRTRSCPPRRAAAPNARTCTSMLLTKGLDQLGDVHSGPAVDLRRILLGDDVDAHVNNASTPGRKCGIGWCHASSAEGLRNHPRRWRGQASHAPDGRPSKARRAVRRPVPPDRLRDLEPHQFGAAAARRADPVQVAQPRPPHLADVAHVAAARLVRRLGAGAAATRQALVLRLGRRDPAEPQPDQRREARHRRRDRRRPRLPDGLPADARCAHRIRRPRHGRRHPSADRRWRTSSA